MRMRRVIPVLFLSFLLSASSALGKGPPTEFDAYRNCLIAEKFSEILPVHHIDQRRLDDKLSQAAYKLYIKQLDPRKLLLLKEDMRKLDIFAEAIDDEIRSCRILLPDAAMKLLNLRAEEAKLLVGQILAAGFDPNGEDYYQTDPDKQDYPADGAELKDRWRRYLKLEVLDSYLEEVEKENTTREKQGKPSVDADSPQVDKRLWAAAEEKVRRKTVRYLNRVEATRRQEYYSRYFDAVARGFDPHTNYIDSDSKEDLRIHLTGSFEGIGAVLREDDGNIKVTQIIPGSPAEQQGQLQVEDIITAVSEKNGELVDISAMTVQDAVKYIRGDRGTEVRLTVSRADGSRLLIPIIRNVVRLEETYVKSAVLVDKKKRKIGYIRIPVFYRDFAAGRNARNVTDDTRNELRELKRAEISGLILDLRDNGGGSLSDAVKVSGLFLSGGPVVQIKDFKGKIEWMEDDDSETAYNGPLVVLVNQFSASASEILAAALQDYGRALIVGGAHTHGKGTVQSLQDLGDLGELKITIQKFYRINGESTQYRGIIPDVVLPSMLDYLETGEQYLDNSLTWDQVKPTAFSPWQGPRINPRQAALKSSAYLAASEKFKKIKTESLKAKERKDKSLVPVFLTGVIQERKELERARKETEAAGVIDAEEDEKSAGGKKEKKTLAEQLENDPYADIALFFLNNSSDAAPGKQIN